MFKRAIILLAIIGIIITGCSKKVVKEEVVAEKELSLLQEKLPNDASAEDNSISVEAKTNHNKSTIASFTSNDMKKSEEWKTLLVERDEYVIGSEDVLEILVWRNEMLSRPRIVVRPDGKISLPLIGEIPAAGFTALQLKEEIEKRLKEYQELPTVTVIVSEINSYYIYILGEIARPGRYQLKSNISVLQAVSLAGGLTNWASPNSMVVLRKNVDKEEKIKVRYKKIISGSRPEDNIILKPGDTIIIP